MSMTYEETHLTEEQIDDALMGGLDALATAHLNACTDCAARLAEAEMPLASFKAVTTAWSERQSATMPALTPLRPRLGARGRLAAWSTALTVMIVAGIAVPMLLHPDHAEGGDGKTVQAVQTPASGKIAVTDIAASNAAVAEGVHDSEATGTATAGLSAKDQVARDQIARDTIFRDNISQDNAMLQDIDRELDASTATPAVLTLERPRGPLAKSAIVYE